MPGIAKEFIGSGEGDSRTIDGMEGTRTFVVHTTYIDDEPTEVVESAIPMNSPHPKAKFKNMKVYGYLKYDHVAPTTWFVDVLYRSEASDVFTGWLVNVQSNASTEHVTVDLDGQLIGPLVYRPTADQNGATHTAKTSTEDGIVYLLQTSQTRIEGFDRVGRESVLTASGTLTAMNRKKIESVMAYRGKCNKNEFWGFAPGMLLFTNFSVEETIGIIPGSSRVSGYVYPTTLEFQYRPQGWEWEQRVDTWIDENGSESAIEALASFEIKRKPVPILVVPKDSRVQVRFFRLYDSFEFTDIFNTLGKPSQTIMPTGSR